MRSLYAARERSSQQIGQGGDRFLHRRSPSMHRRPAPHEAASCERARGHVAALDPGTDRPAGQDADSAPGFDQLQDRFGQRNAHHARAPTSASEELGTDTLELARRCVVHDQRLAQQIGGSDLARRRLARVPVLEIAPGRYLTEVAAITTWLDTKTPMLPRDPE